MTKKTALERLAQDKQTKRVLLEKSFGGMAAGQHMFVATPSLVANYIKNIPYGETRSVENMRADLAIANGCAGTCPMSTAIFIRIAGEASLEQIAAGYPAADVIPIWRIIDGSHKIAKRLNVDSAWLNEQRGAEVTPA